MKKFFCAVLVFGLILNSSYIGITNEMKVNATNATNYWVVTPCTTPAAVTFSNNQLVLSNGLIERTISTVNGTTTSFKNLYKSSEYIFNEQPEAIIGLDGVYYYVGGNGEQSKTFIYEGYSEGNPEKPFEWSPNKPYSDLNEPTDWPPEGKALTVTYAANSSFASGYRNLKAEVRYEIYKGIPVIMKKVTLINNGTSNVKVTYMASEVLTVKSELKNMIWVESEFHGSTENDSRRNDVFKTTEWTDFTEYSLLKSRFDLGPDKIIAGGGGSFTGIRTFELLHSVTWYEQQQLEIKKMYRTLCPWSNDNPIYTHVISDNENTVRNIIDQAAEVGFEMVIQSFSSGINIESTDVQYITAHKSIYDYAHSKGVEMGAYTFLGTDHGGDYIPGGTAWGSFTCAASNTFNQYWSKVKNFITQTGLDMLEIDGPYPMFACSSTTHSNHIGNNDSTVSQWENSTVNMGKWLRENGKYIQAPDWLFYNGYNKADMGYDEMAMTAPRKEQLIYQRQALYNGTYEKTPAMGWYFVPLLSYQGGGADACFQPLSQNIQDYDWALAANFGAGVNACYRGTELYDSAQTKGVVKKWVDFYKKYRGILNSDIVHIKAPVMDSSKNNQKATGMDAMMHVNSQLQDKGLMMVYNQTDVPRTETITVPLFYTGLTNLEEAPVPVPGSFPVKLKQYASWDIDPYFPVAPTPWTYPSATPTANTVTIMKEGANPQTYNIDSNGNVLLQVTLPPMSYTYYNIYDPNNVPPVVIPPQDPEWSVINDSQLTYTGNWIRETGKAQEISSDAHYATTNGSSVQYTFNGTDVKWIGQKDISFGYADVFIDDALQATVDCYSSMDLFGQELFTKTELTPYNHTIKIARKGTKNSNSTNYTIDIDAILFRTAGNATQLTNVAAGKTPITSAVFSNTGRITDGDKSTNNFSDSYPNNGLRWVKLDLGGSTNISGVKLWHYYGDARKYHDVIIQLSNTEDFSNDVTTVFNNDADNSAGQGIGTDAEYTEASTGKEIAFTAVNARYVRFWSNGSTMNGSNHYVEIEVMGEALIPTPTPTPTPVPTIVTNVAIGKTPTTSASFSNICRMTDGDKNTNNFSDSYPNNGLRWVKLDLSSSINISGIKLWHYFGDTRSYHDVIIQLSNTADFSNGVTTVFNNDNDNTAGQGTGADAEYVETSAGKEITFSPVNARYVRFWSNGNTLNGSNHYVEFEIMGEVADQTTGFYPNWKDIPSGPFQPIPANGNINSVLKASNVTDVNAKFVADPFIFHENDQWYMFFEVADQNYFGKIGLATSDDGLTWNYQQIVLSSSHHLALPHVFKYDGNYYMVPDSGGQANSVELYRATNFPTQWTLEANLVSGRKFVDTAIVPYNGKFWMFTGDQSNSNCYLYYSDSLTSGWVQHPLSPVIANNTGTGRIGGRAFVYNNKLIRIVQKCDVRYGEAIRAFEVDNINPVQYSEHEITPSPLLGPTGNGWSSGGIHTFDPWWVGDHWLIAVDGYNIQTPEDNWEIGIFTSN